jgi:serine/threonine protein kinase
LVDGMSLTDLNGIMGRSQRPPGAVLDLGIQIAEALAYLHDGVCDDQARPLDLIHGNLRPHNVFVTREGFTKLGEVGLSFPMASAALEKKVKLPYLAPEQFGRHPIDARSDIYALGVILIELLSGQSLAPFGALALHDVKAWQVDLEQSLSPDLGDYLSSMISSSCHGRPQTAVQVARDLRRFFQRFGAGQTLATYVAEHVFENVPTMEAAEAVDIQALQRRCAESVTHGGSGVTVLPDDALEELSYPSTVSLIIDDIDWDSIDEVDEDKYAGSIKVLNPIMDTQDLLPSNAELSKSNELDDRPRTLRLGDEGRRIIAQDPAFRRALGLNTAKAVEDRKEWDYYLVAGDELGARIIQKSLTSARPYQDQVVVFLKGSDLLAGFDLEADAQPLEHGSVWAGDDSGYGESSSPAQDPSYLRYHERVLVRSAPRRGTSVRGRVLRFLSK